MSGQEEPARWLVARWPLAVVAVWALGGTVCGCSRPYEDKFSRARPPAFKATGRVTWNGSPAKGALMTLPSASHNLASSGKADSAGNFVLTTWRLGDGAVAGVHRVSVETIVITGYTGDGDPIEVNEMPPTYQNPETSGLMATISERGPNVLEFEVTGPRSLPGKTVRP
jgi:hypothetical protein